MKTKKGFILLTLAILVTGFAEGFAVAAEFQAVSVSGPVTMIRAGKSKVIQNGEALQSGDRLTTNGDSRLDIIKAGGWGYRLLQSSDCVIHTVAGKTEIEMLQGNVIFKIIPTKGRNLTVRTPVVVAAVRGTQFWGQVTPSGESHNAIFAVREGSVKMTVLKSKKTWMLKAGQAMEIHGDEGTAETRAAKPAELEAIGQIADLDLA